MVAAPILVVLRLAANYAIDAPAGGESASVTIKCSYSTDDGGGYTDFFTWTDSTSGPGGSESDSFTVEDKIIQISHSDLSQLRIRAWSYATCSGGTSGAEARINAYEGYVQVAGGQSRFSLT
jgi:hypothetical protein